MDPLAILIAQIAAVGAVGLFAVAMVERLLPILPSYALLVAVGVAAAEGQWPLAVAMVATITGGIVSCFVVFMLARLLDERRAMALLSRTAWVFAVSPKRVEPWVQSFRRNQRVLAFGTQLVPTIRLISPAIGGLLQADAVAFLFNTGLGLAVWNTTFIVVGYIAAIATETVNITATAFQTLAVLVLIELAVTAVWRFQSVKRRRIEP